MMSDLTLHMASVLLAEGFSAEAIAEQLHVKIEDVQGLNRPARDLFNSSAIQKLLDTEEKEKMPFTVVHCRGDNLHDRIVLSGARTMEEAMQQRKVTGDLVMTGNQIAHEIGWLWDWERKPTANSYPMRMIRKWEGKEVPRQ